MVRDAATAFEFLSNALRGAVDFCGGLGDEVGNGRANEEDDVRKVKRAMTTLGRLEEPEDEPTGIIDRPLDTAIRGFQRDKGLRVDGFMRPDGPTQQSLRSDLLGFLREEKESDRGDGSDGFRSGWLNPAAALRAERDSAGGLFDRDRERSDRSSGLVEIAERAKSAGKTDSRTEQESRDSTSSVRGFRTDQVALARRPTGWQRRLDEDEGLLRGMEDAWRKQGMTDAARHLKHYLDGTGECITYSRDRARSFNPVRNAEQDARAKIRAAILEKARGLKDGERFTGRLRSEDPGTHDTISHGLDMLRGILDQDRWNDNLATGRTTIVPHFEGAISREGDDITLDGVVRYDWNDRYDFHPGQPFGSAAINLTRHRGAKEFAFGGSWRQTLKGGIDRRGERLLPDLSFTDVD